MIWTIFFWLDVILLRNEEKQLPELNAKQTKEDASSINLLFQKAAIPFWFVSSFAAVTNVSKKLTMIVYLCMQIFLMFQIESSIEFINFQLQMKMRRRKRKIWTRSFCYHLLLTVVPGVTVVICADDNYSSYCLVKVMTAPVNLMEEVIDSYD